MAGTRSCCTGLKTDFVHLEQGMTRINVKIKAGQETELNGAGPDIPESAMQELEKKLDSLNEDDILILAGSIPGKAFRRIPTSGCWPGCRAGACVLWWMPPATCW